jgi:hypothetical protein
MAMEMKVVFALQASIRALRDTDLARHMLQGADRAAQPKLVW